MPQPKRQPESAAKQMLPTGFTPLFDWPGRDMAARRWQWTHCVTDGEQVREVFECPEPGFPPTYWTLRAWCSGQGPTFKFARSPHGDVLLIRHIGSIAVCATIEQVATPIGALAYAVDKVTRAADLDELSEILNRIGGSDLVDDPEFFAASTELPTFGGSRPDAEAVSWDHDRRLAVHPEADWFYEILPR
jgi:hypothetical protein